LLSADLRGARLTIEGAAFHWIAFGCETKPQAHQESHSHLGAFLRKRGESPVADQWERIDQLRQGGWFGTRTDPVSAQAALAILSDIRALATAGAARRRRLSAGMRRACKRIVRARFCTIFYPMWPRWE
jgi:hypothetical protein